MPIYTEKIKKNGKSIEKKVNGQKRYYIRTYVEDEFGNRKQITRHNKKWLGKNGYIKAMQEEVRLKNEKVIKENKEKNLTLRELKNKYLEYIKPRVDIDTLKDKENKLNHFCENDKTNQVKTYPNATINFFNKQIYQKWQIEMKEKKYKKGKDKNGNDLWYLYSIKRLNKIHNEICNFIDYLIIEGCCRTNFARQAGKIGTPKEIKMGGQKKEYIIINFEEYLKLMEATKDNLKYNTLFDLMFSRGPRAGEIRAFRIQDYSYEKKQLMVNFTLSKDNKLKETKTASSKATIDLDDKLNEKINKLINNLKKNDDFNDKWFIFNGKTPLSFNAMNYNKEKYFKLADIKKHLRLHDFRHSCASWLFSVGTPITVISKILRHKNINITLSVYTHLIEEEYKRELIKLNSIKINLINKTKNKTNNL